MAIPDLLREERYGKLPHEHNDCSQKRKLARGRIGNQMESEDPRALSVMGTVLQNQMAPPVMSPPPESTNDGQGFDQSG